MACEDVRMGESEPTTYGIFDLEKFIFIFSIHSTLSVTLLVLFCFPVHFSDVLPVKRKKNTPKIPHQQLHKSF